MRLSVSQLQQSQELLNQAPLWLRLLIAALATWRLSSLLVNPNEVGPGKLLHKIRDWAGIYELGEDDEPLTNLGKLFACIWCMSMWVAVPVAIMAVSPIWALLIPLALSAAAIIAHECIQNSKNE